MLRAEFRVFYFFYRLRRLSSSKDIYVLYIDVATKLGGNL